MRALTLIAVTALAAGCGADDTPPVECTIGDPTQPIELELLANDGGQTISGLQAPMTAVPLVFPDRNVGGLVQQNVGRHEDGIIK